MPYFICNRANMPIIIELKEDDDPRSAVNAPIIEKAVKTIAERCDMNYYDHKVMDAHRIDGVVRFWVQMRYVATTFHHKGRLVETACSFIPAELVE